MSPKHIFQKGYAYFITTNTVNNSSIFKDDDCCKALLNDFNYYRQKLGFFIYAYVIMPTHFHWIIHPNERASVSVIMKKIKGHSAFTINKMLDHKGSFWQENYHSHVIRNKFDFEEKANYIHRNPVRSNLSKNMEDYMYSSYRNYYFDDNRVFKIDVPLL